MDKIQKIHLITVWVDRADLSAEDCEWKRSLPSWELSPRKMQTQQVNHWTFDGQTMSVCFALSTLICVGHKRDLAQNCQSDTVGHCADTVVQYLGMNNYSIKDSLCIRETCSWRRLFQISWILQNWALISWIQINKAASLLLKRDWEHHKIFNKANRTRFKVKWKSKLSGEWHFTSSGLSLPHQRWLLIKKSKIVYLYNHGSDEKAKWDLVNCMVR